MLAGRDLVVLSYEWLFFLYWWRGLGRTEWQEEIRHWEVVENDTATNCARPRSRKDPVSFLSLAIIHPNTLILFMPITERDGQKRRDCCQNFARVQQKSINRIQGGVCSVISSRAEPHLLLSTVRFIRYLSPHRSSMASYSPLYRGVFCIQYFLFFIFGCVKRIFTTSKTYVRHRYTLLRLRIWWEGNKLIRINSIENFVRRCLGAITLPYLPHTGLKGVVRYLSETSSSSSCGKAVTIYS